MNRRDALRFGLVAPFVAPAIVKAAMDGSRFGQMGMATVRLDASGIDATLRSRLAELRAISSAQLMTMAEARSAAGYPIVADANVEAQMLEHNLFEPKEFKPAAHRSAA